MNTGKGNIDWKKDRPKNKAFIIGGNQVYGRIADISSLEGVDDLLIYA